MKKTSKNRFALTSIIVGLPLSTTAYAQTRTPSDAPTVDQTTRPGTVTLSQDVCCKFAERFTKVRASYTLIGMDDGHPIYQNARSQYFYLDAATGDMIFVEPVKFMKQREGAARQAVPVTIRGMDDAGHVIQTNSRGESFYLEPSTGDMVFVK
ncbi:MAG: hypothetical protein ACJ8BF_14315 [Gemmatimonadales bacterium]